MIDWLCLFLTYRIVKSFENVASTYVQQIPVNTTVTFETPFVTVTAENVTMNKYYLLSQNMVICLYNKLSL